MTILNTLISFSKQIPNKDSRLIFSMNHGYHICPKTLRRSWKADSACGLVDSVIDCDLSSADVWLPTRKFA